MLTYDLIWYQESRWWHSESGSAGRPLPARQVPQSESRCTGIASDIELPKSLLHKSKHRHASSRELPLLILKLQYRDVNPVLLLVHQFWITCVMWNLQRVYEICMKYTTNFGCDIALKICSHQIITQPPFHPSSWTVKIICFETETTHVIRAMIRWGCVTLIFFGSPQARPHTSIAWK